MVCISVARTRSSRNGRRRRVALLSSSWVSAPVLLALSVAVWRLRSNSTCVARLCGHEDAAQCGLGARERAATANGGEGGSRPLAAGRHHHTLCLHPRHIGRLHNTCQPERVACAPPALSHGACDPSPSVIAPARPARSGAASAPRHPWREAPSKLCPSSPAHTPAPAQRGEVSLRASHRVSTHSCQQACQTSGRHRM